MTRKANADLTAARSPHLGEARRHVGHVESAGGGVEEPDADEHEGRSDGARHEVAQSRQLGSASASEGDQHVRGKRSDFEEHEEIEEVSGDHDSRHSRQAEHQNGVEEMPAPGIHFALDARPGQRKHHRCHHRDDDEDECAEEIDPVLDAPGRRPASERVSARSLRQCLREQQHGDSETRERPQRRDGLRRASRPENHAQGRADERNDHLQRRQVVDCERDHD